MLLRFWTAIQGNKQPVADGIRDIEIVILHESWVVMIWIVMIWILMIQVQLSKPVDARDFSQWRVAVAVVDEMEQFVVQKTGKPGNGEQQAEVGSCEPPQKQGDRAAGAHQEEKDQDGIRMGENRTALKSREVLQVFPWADLQICSRQIRKRPQDSEEQRGGFRFNERSPGVLSGYPWKRHSMLRRLPRMAVS